MNTFIVPSSSRSGGCRRVLAAPKKRVWAPFIGPRNTLNPFKRFSFEERLAFGLEQRFRQTPAEFLFKFEKLMKKGAVRYDAQRESWVQIPGELYRDVYRKINDAYQSDLRKRERLQRRKFGSFLQRSYSIDFGLLNHEDCFPSESKNWSWEGDWPCDCTASPSRTFPRPTRYESGRLISDFDRLNRKMEVVFNNQHLKIKIRKIIQFLGLNRMVYNHIFNYFDKFNFNKNYIFNRPYNFSLYKKLVDLSHDVVSSSIEDGMIPLDEIPNNSEILEDIPLNMVDPCEKEYFDLDDVQFAKLRVVEAQAEMEEPHGDCDSIAVEQKENVILTSHSTDSVAKPVEVTPGVWEDLCSPQQIKEYTQLMSRWQLFSQLEWSKDDKPGHELWSKKLPYDFVKEKSRSPSTALFSQYAYFRSDFEVKIVVNSNKFHCGMLQASFYYGAESDLHYKDRNNVYSASQLTHCIIDSAQSSDGILKIPYRYYKPLLATMARDDDKDILNIGRMRILVLNSLQAVNDNNPVSVSVFLRFTNPSFHGMKPRELGIQSEMLGLNAVVTAAANMVNQNFPDPQRDNPSDVIPAKPMVPWSAHSWCVGDMLPEPTNVLRLQGSGNTPHPPGSLSAEPEMNIDYVKRIYGLFRTFKWSTSDKKGKVLYRIPFSPKLDEYPKMVVSHETARSCDVMPPLSVLASLFAYWRGSIEYRLDFVSTSFHTGRLIIAYMPLLDAMNDINPDLLTYCDHIIVDLRDSKQINYVNSFLSDKPWYPLRSATHHSTVYRPPGYIYIAVLNELNCVNTVSNFIEINAYMRAGEDFELHVPTAPRIGLSWNTDLLVPSTVTITYLDSYGPPDNTIGIGPWREVGNYALLRYGSGSDHMVQFSRKDLKETNNVFVAVENYGKGKIQFLDKKTADFITFFTIDDTYVYAAVFRDSTEAFNFQTKLGKFGKLTPDAKKLLLPIDNDQTYHTDTVRYMWSRVKPAADDFEFVLAEAGGEERDTVCGDQLEVQKSVRSTQGGMLTFGEKIYSLKQLVRRYQLYSHDVIALPASSDSNLAIYSFPVMPQGLDLDIKPSGVEDIYANRMRDGPIPIIASGYRFFRGSVRMRILVVSDVNAKVWVQHRPDYKFITGKTYTPSKLSTEAYFHPGYASNIQFLKVNNVMEVEVPFYLPGQFGLLQRPNLQAIEDTTHYALGQMFLGVVPQPEAEFKSIKLQISVHYSMGDDMSFSVFQGFPPMIDLDLFEKDRVVSEGPLDIFGWMRSRVESSMASTVNDRIKDAVKDTEYAISDSDDVGETVSHIVEKLIPDLTVEKKAALLSFLTNMVHIGINPSIRTIAWSIASIFINLGLLCYSYIERFCNALQRLFNYLRGKEAQKSESAKDGTIIAKSEAGEPQDDVTAAFISTCLTGILAAAGAREPLPRSIPQFSKYLYQGLPKFALTSNYVFTFLRNNMLMFKKMWYWLVSKFNKDYILYTELAESTGEVKDFLKRIQWSLDCGNAQRVRNDPSATAQVYQLANVAQAYMVKRATTTIAKQMPLFDYYCKKIVALRDELTKEMLCPNIRFEPYVIGINGPINIGKSHCAQSVACEILKSINYKSYEELVYTRTPANAYWNGLKNQPVCLFDDFLNVLDPTFALPSIGELYCLKSKAVFNPPMAAVEEKKIRYNPLIVLLCSNKAFPKVEGLACEEAWFRRRDVLLEARVKDKFKGIHPRQMDSETKKTYGHLEFAFYKNTAGTQACDQQTENTWMSYLEMLNAVQERFVDYYQEECKQYDRAIHKIRAFHPTDEKTSEEYVIELEQLVKDINETRVPAEDQKWIKWFKKGLLENQYVDSMTSYVQNVIADSKIKALKKEKEVLEKAKKAVAEAVKPVEAVASSSVVKANGEAGDDITVESTEAQRAEFLADVLIHKAAEMEDEWEEPVRDPVGDDVLIMKAHDANSAMIADSVRPDFIKNLDYKTFVEMVHSENRKIFFDQYVRNYSGCYCWIDHLLGHDCYDNNGKLEIKSHMDYCYINRNGRVENTRFVQPCATLNCCYRDQGFFFWLISNDYHFARTSPRTWPKVLQDFKNGPQAAKPEEKVLLMTPAEADKVINEEIGDKAWYTSLWEKIPGFGTIWTLLAKATAIIGTIALLVSCTANIMYTPKRCALIDSQLTNAVEATAALVSHRNEQMTEWQPTKSFSEGGAGYSKGVIASKPSAKVPIKAFAQASSGIQDVVANKIKRNTFWIVAEFTDADGKNRVRQFRCLGLVKKYFIIIDHYIFYLQKCRNLKLYYVFEQIMLELPLSILDCNCLVDSAIYVGKMIKTVPDFTNIIKFIVSSNVTGNLPPQAKLLEYCVDVNKNEFVMNCHFINRIERQSRVSVNNEDGSCSLVNCLYAYPYSGKGMCGSVLVSASNLSAPILGIHIAGKVEGGCGFAEALVNESFLPLLEDDEPMLNEDTIVEVSSEANPVASLDGNCVILGTIDKKFACYPAKQSRLINTENAGIITDITYDVPVLSSKDARIVSKPFSPLVEGCKHHTNPCKTFEAGYISRAVEDVNNKILTYALPRRLEIGPLTVEQAVCGLPNNPLYEPMAMDTSEGFPWIHMRPAGASNKSWMFDRELTSNGWILKGMNEELKQALKNKLESRKRGEYIQTVFVDCLKDAKLPVEKVLTPGKTRIFSISPVDFTIQQRQYSMDFVVAYQNSRFKTGHAIGIDIYSEETDRMINWLLEYGDNFICGDYSKFGDQLLAELIYEFYLMMIKWYKRYGDKNAEWMSYISNILKCFANETMNSVHLMINFLYQCMGGMPSGNPLTVIINSYVGGIYVRVVWQIIMFRTNRLYLMDMLSFNENVREVVYGDDVQMSVKDEVKEFFNAVTISEVFSEYNIKFTNSLKDGNMVPYTSIYDPATTFLKCTFHKHEKRGLWMARLEQRVVLETSNWTWNTQRDVQKASIEACSEMVGLAFGHGKTFHSMLREKVIDFWSGRGVNVIIPDWDAIDFRIYDQGMSECFSLNKAYLCKK